MKVYAFSECFLFSDQYDVRREIQELHRLIEYKNRERVKGIRFQPRTNFLKEVNDDLFFYYLIAKSNDLFKNNSNRKHSENADIITPVTFDLCL